MPGSIWPSNARNLPAYWLHIAIPGAKTLYDLDRFLRDIWLECCGHLSGFAINGVRFENQPADETLFGRPPDQSMSAKIDKVLEPGMEFSYEYDYGSTTDLVLTVAGVFQAPLVRGDSVRLLARNLPPEFHCAGCGRPATRLANGGGGLNPEDCYCKDCAEELDEEEQDMPMPIVNSPRVGVCGYCG